MFLYAAHDDTVAMVMDTLGIFNGIAPPYCSTLIVELLDREGLKVIVCPILFSDKQLNKNENVQVQFSYRNDSSLEPHPLTLPGCSQLCPLERFKGLGYFNSVFE